MHSAQGRAQWLAPLSRLRLWPSSLSVTGAFVCSESRLTVSGWRRVPIIEPIVARVARRIGCLISRRIWSARAGHATASRSRVQTGQSSSLEACGSRVGARIRIRQTRPVRHQSFTRTVCCACLTTKGVGVTRDMAMAYAIARADYTDTELVDRAVEWRWANPGIAWQYREAWAIRCVGGKEGEGGLVQSG